MPLARIITRVRQDADELANDLRGRGFNIEIVSPADVPNHPVDLEVSLEECAAEEALTDAESASQPQDVCVFIAPGALVESARPMVVIPLFSDPAAEVQVPEQPTLVEEVTVHQDEPQLAALAASDDVVEVAEPSAIELPARGDELESEFPEDSPAIILEGETVTRPQPQAASAVHEGRKIQPHPALRIRITQSDKVFWRVTTAVAILSVCGLLTLSAHRQPPLPSALEQPSAEVQQAAPFVRAQGKAASPSAGKATARPPVIATAELKPNAARAERVRRSPARAITRVAASTRHPASRNPESDLIAEDTVIRYGRAAAPPPLQAQKKSAIKRYTDLN
ncbi:MAG: hypothetical protein LAO03_00340 [Acidobacteriia bacterium]|nr:hypothetical protein [Terriglobia bacterium]